MRIIAGAWRGRPLIAPAGRSTRPTSDRAREGLFSMLTSRIGSFEDLRVADLFAGTGALGLEALSRGAAHCTFVESDRQAVAALERNVGRLGAGERSEIRARPVEHAGPPRQPCYVIFMDPPYRAGLAQAALDQMSLDAWLAPGGWIAIETGRETIAIPAGLAVEGERRFGKARLLLLRRIAAAPSGT
jgi:16S rRNA (guanine966-N2)-methyltransferase